MKQVGIDGETRWKPGYKVVIMADTVLIYTQGHPRGFKISLSLGDPTVRELLKQVQMLIPDQHLLLPLQPIWNLGAQPIKKNFLG